MQEMTCKRSWRSEAQNWAWEIHIGHRFDCLTTFCNRAQRCSALGRAAREERSGITSRGRKVSLPTLAISYSFLFTFVTEKQREIIQGNAHSIDLFVRQRDSGRKWRFLQSMGNIIKKSICGQSCI